MQGFQSACFFRSAMFGPHLPWVVVGVNMFCDSMIQVGGAERLENLVSTGLLARTHSLGCLLLTGTLQWIPHAVIKAPIHNKDRFPEGCICYCIYAHPWAFADDSTSLFVTWSEQYPGEVIGAKLTFETGKSILCATCQAFLTTSRTRNVVGEDLVTRIPWFVQINLPKFAPSDHRLETIWNRTEADLESDGDFLRIKSEADITIAQGDVLMKVCLPTNVPYLLLKVSHPNITTFITSCHTHCSAL